MAGVFDLKKGAFDSSEASRLHKAFDIALQGLRATHKVDSFVAHRLARSVVKVARTEPDCLNNDGTIDPIKLAHRAMLRMLQLSAPARGLDAGIEEAKPMQRLGRRRPSDGEGVDSPGKVMLKLFERTTFAKL